MSLMFGQRNAELNVFETKNIKKNSPRSYFLSSSTAGKTRLNTNTLLSVVQGLTEHYVPNFIPGHLLSTSCFSQIRYAYVTF